MSSRVTVKDNGAAALLARAKTLAAGRVVRVGVLADAPKDPHEGEKPSGMTLLEVAAVHEFGAPAAGIPQRSFIRATIDLHREDIAQLQIVLARRVIAGELTADQALDQLGAKVAAMCQNRIAEGISPALHPDTIAKKGSSTPLVDTGQLRSSIAWKVL